MATKKTARNGATSISTLEHNIEKKEKHNQAFPSLNLEGWTWRKPKKKSPKGQNLKMGNNCSCSSSIIEPEKGILGIFNKSIAMVIS